MKYAGGILLVVAGAVAVVQFIRPERNVSPGPDHPAGGPGIMIPDEVRGILQTSCFDCHSNNTRYPWYAEVQPVGWWLASHIRNGKRGLNFDEFGSYPARRKFIKLRQIEDQLVKKEMPLRSYLIIHRNAILSDEQKLVVIGWSRAMRDSLRSDFPPDSLERRPERK